MNLFGGVCCAKETKPNTGTLQDFFNLFQCRDRYEMIS
jgi:hypothetical protein